MKTYQLLYEDFPYICDILESIPRKAIKTIGGAFGLNIQPRSCFSCLRSGILDKAVITIIFFKLSIVNLAVASFFVPVAQTACAVYLNFPKT